MSSSTNNEWPWQQPKEPIVRGAFIVIEGMDRAGKTTQVQKLCRQIYAEGGNVKMMRFPDRTTPMGKMIDSYLQSKTEMDDHAIHLLFSANRWEKAQYISDTLSKGYTIVCDRYYYSGMVYSAAKQNPNLTLEWARKPDEGLPKPDVVVFLDLDPEEAEKRGGFGDEKYENRAVQERVRQLFLSLRYGQTEEACDLVVVGAGGSVDEVARQVRAAATGQLSSVARGLLREDVMKVQGWPDGTMAAIQEAKHKASYEL